ncbi:hypothetical protein [Kibdelosporangium aridum]|uniref:Uncharacterized protein n=1 Tax=Kibdelosporangium aridum TaxID=2030 RepID=A0A1W2FJ65_KIBAR|nr:hypothetical protein [Kibdelosporangium aridum]SMD22055.1 hypothetical protein SAMN05661093_07287 [Kibdelosporangium aridum]
MGPQRLTTGPRWVLLCLLLFGVIGMHHFLPADAQVHHTATVATTDMPQPHPDEPSHDLLHLCMAVMCAFGGFLLVTMLLTKSVTALVPPLRTWRHISRVDRPPSGRDLLSCVCVLRL